MLVHGGAAIPESHQLIELLKARRYLQGVVADDGAGDSEDDGGAAIPESHQSIELLKTRKYLQTCVADADDGEHDGW